MSTISNNFRPGNLRPQFQAISLNFNKIPMSPMSSTPWGPSRRSPTRIQNDPNSFQNQRNRDPTPSFCISPRDLQDAQVARVPQPQICIKKPRQTSRNRAKNSGNRLKMFRPCYKICPHERPPKCIHVPRARTRSRGWACWPR